MKWIVIEKELFRISEKDYKEFDRRIRLRHNHGFEEKYDLGKGELEWGVILDFITEKYKPIRTLEGVYNY